MTDFDVNVVSAMSGRYIAAGLDDTWAGQFLSSVVKEGKAPRGRGIALLQDVLTREVQPEDIKKTYDWIIGLCIAGGTSNEYLTRQAMNVRKGYALTDYHRSQIKNIEARGLACVGRVATPEERSLAHNLNLIASNRSKVFWSHRPATFGRLVSLFKIIVEDGMITDSDIMWMKDNFKPAVKELTTPSHPLSSLRWVYNRQFDVHDTVLIVSPTFISTGGELVVDGIVRGEKKEIQIDSLYKRPPKKSKTA